MGCEASFGPKETEETILLAKMKRLNDIQFIRENLNRQMSAERKEKNEFKRRQIEMEKCNIEKSLKIISDAKKSEREKKEVYRKTL